MKIYCAWCGVHLDSGATKFNIESRTYWDELWQEYREAIKCPVCETEIVRDTGELI